MEHADSMLKSVAGVAIFSIAEKEFFQLFSYNGDVYLNIVAVTGEGRGNIYCQLSMWTMILRGFVFKKSKHKNSLFFIILRNYM